MFDQVNTRCAIDATNMQIWCSNYESVVSCFSLYELLCPLPMANMLHI